MTLFEWMNIVSLKDQLNIILWWSTRLVDSEFVGSQCVMVAHLAPLSNNKIMKCFRKKDIACLSIWCCLERGWVFLKNNYQERRQISLSKGKNVLTTVIVVLTAKFSLYCLAAWELWILLLFYRTSWRDFHLNGHFRLRLPLEYSSYLKVH